MHEIQALIGSDAFTAACTRSWSKAVRRELIFGFFIVPLQKEVVRQATGSDWELPDLDDPLEAPEIASVFTPLVDAIRRINVGGSCALVFTQYWGGTGTQASLLVRDGVAQGEPRFGSNAINLALSELGIRADEGSDEFDTVDLGRWRSTESIARGAGKPCGPV